MSDLRTARWVAELLGVCPETVLRWQRRGELPAIRLPGGAIRFDQEAIERWLEERSTTAHPRGRLAAVTHCDEEESHAS